MTLVNLKHRSADGRFNNLIEDFYQGFPSVIKSDFGTDMFRQIPGKYKKKIKKIIFWK
jgi:hypothetical protein